MRSESIDPRWKFLTDGTWRCTGCDEPHEGLMDLACFGPDHWPGGERYEPNSLATTSTHFLSEDFCVIEGRDHFVRCVLQLPLIGAPGHFGFGVWSTLSKQNFQLYVAGFDSGDFGNAGPWFGWFSNSLKCYPPTMNLKCRVHPQPGRTRPLIEIEPTDHPLSVESREGLSYERLLEIFAANGHPLRRGEAST